MPTTAGDSLNTARVERRNNLMNTPVNRPNLSIQWQADLIFISFLTAKTVTFITLHSSPSLNHRRQVLVSLHGIKVIDGGVLIKDGLCDDGHFVRRRMR